MIDQYFGIKELFEIVLRAKTQMTFGDRIIEADEPVLYFEKANLGVLNENNHPIVARGGWLNQPHVVWDSRSEVTFSISEGVISSIGMAILLGTNLASRKENEAILVHKCYGPVPIQRCTWDNSLHGFLLNEKPVMYPDKKTFIFEYNNDVIQRKAYGQLHERDTDFGKNYFVAIYEDKACTIPAKINKQYLIDYYYEYRDEALLYTVSKERFNGLFTLEGKFYSKDENEGKDYVNLIYMPRVRVVSNIDLRLGERTSPAVAVFNMIGLPETTASGKDGLIMDIIRLGNVDENEI